MSEVYRANRKASDADVIRLNSVGLSLGTVADALDCHPTTITQRLRSLGIPPADTRRTFMEDVFMTLDLDQREWLADQVSENKTIREFISEIIVNEYNRSKGSSNV